MSQWPNCFLKLTHWCVRRFLIITKTSTSITIKRQHHYFAGASELLLELRADGYKLAVATGKGRQGLQRVWQQSGTGDLFHSSRCSDEAHSKPSPDMLQQLLLEMQLESHQAIMIGDSEYDMAMAKAINMDRIGLFWCSLKRTLADPAAIDRY